MKKLVNLLFICFLINGPLFDDKIIYAEQYYKLYHQHLYHYPDDSLEIIRYLELALAADFANPLYALARIRNKTEYQRYCDLFRMHINLKIVQQYLHLGSKYDKFEVYFFNKEGPWLKAICDSLKIARWAYQTALQYWAEAKKWSAKAYRLYKVHLPEIQHWEDENYRIETGDLDYQKIIQKQLNRIAQSQAYLGCQN